jgi:enterochelin esterase family protein
MVSVRQITSAAVITVVASFLLTAQVPAVRSPEVHPDRTVTFRLRAPQATAVEVVGEVVQGKGPQPMTKGSDGVWTLTVGPLSPEIWIYNFRIQGVDFPDSANISIMPRAAGTGSISSFVEVPGDGSAFYDSRPVPHGEVRMVLYRSKAMGVDRYLWVYTPPNYDRSTRKYPVYYLLHGNGETQAGWVMNGRANIILDNLIADGKAQPMVVVMPHGHAVQSASVGPLAAVTPTPADFRDFTLFTKDFLEEIIPMVEKNYRVFTDADHRAIGGLSMGAMQAVSIGLSHPDLFHYVLAYSGGFGSLATVPAAVPVEDQTPWKALLANSTETKKWLHLLFLGSGQQETGMLNAGQRLVQLFREKGINAHWADHPGGHVFSVWRKHLNGSLPLLFQTNRKTSSGEPK